MAFCIFGRGFVLSGASKRSTVPGRRCQLRGRPVAILASWPLRRDRWYEVREIQYGLRYLGFGRRYLGFEMRYSVQGEWAAAPRSAA